MLRNGFNVLSGSEILRGDKDILGVEVVSEESMVQESPLGVLPVLNLGPPFPQWIVLEQSIKSSFLWDPQ